MLAVIRFPILERIDLPGEAAISPHGVGIAVGFVLGAWLMTSRARKRGFAHEYAGDVSDLIQRLLGRAMIGALMGARLFYVLRDYITEGTNSVYWQDPASILRVWEGGLTFLGGVAGAVLVAWPYVRSQHWRFQQVMDSAVVGIMGGLIIGRLGDLVIGDHLGGPTDFFLGWRCTGNWYDSSTSTWGFVDPLPYPSGVEPVAGCFDVAVHQTALYDFGAALVVLGLLLWFERSPRFDGFFIAATVYGYGSLRFLGDFARNDERVAGLTGSQYAVLAAMVAVTVWLLRTKPWEDRPWAWDLRFEHPWLVPPHADSRPADDVSDKGDGEPEAQPEASESDDLEPSTGRPRD